MYLKARLIATIGLFLVILSSCNNSDSSLQTIEGDLMMNEDPIISKETNMQNDKIVITGNLSYFQRIALPTDSIAIITLRDISIPDLTSPIISKKMIKLDGAQVPIPFKMMVNSDALVLGLTYSIQGKIVDSNENLLWVTDTSYLIEPSKPHNDLGILKLKAVRQIDKKANSSLHRKEWIVENIGGNGVIDRSHTTLSFRRNMVISGRAGCNNYSGFYTLTDKSLSIEKLVITQKACVPALSNQEAKFISLLEKISHYSIDKTNALILETAQGETIIAR